MNETLRGVIVFVAILLTIGIWAPLRNYPQRMPSGAVITETYFGVLTYLTLRTETKEPDYKMSWTPDYKRLAMTGGLTAVLWGGVIAAVKKKKRKVS